MKCLVIIPAILLSGCLYQSVDQYRLHKAISHCGSVEKISEIRSHSIGHVVVDCTDKEGKRL